MMSVEMTKVDEWAKTIDNNLKAIDFEPNRFVVVEHEDGSRFLFASSFIVEKDGFQVVFTEHHGYHIFDKNTMVSKFTQE
jgi:hypothetical protein